MNRREGLGKTHGTVGDVAAYLNVAQSTVLRMLETADLRSLRIRRKVLVEWLSVDEYVAEQREVPHGDDHLQRRVSDQRRARNQAASSAIFEQLTLPDS